MLIAGLSLRFQVSVYVVVQFYSWFKFYFPLFVGMVMYDTINETMGNKNNLKQG